MMLALLPLVSLAVASPSVAGAPAGTTASAHASTTELVSGRVAQVRLAETLGEAQSIESVSARGRTVTFVIVHAGDSLEVVATTRARGDVVALEIREIDPVGAELHGLSWLATELATATAVTRLVVDEEGAVTIRTSDHRTYMAIPGRGSGGSGPTPERWPEH